MITTIETVVTETVVISDATDKPINSFGWAIVRRSDGVEVAHFQNLRDLVEHGEKLERAATKAAK